jgi:hypothetical protein
LCSEYNWDYDNHDYDNHDYDYDNHYACADNNDNDNDAQTFCLRCL